MSDRRIRQWLSELAMGITIPSRVLVSRVQRIYPIPGLSRTTSTVYLILLYLFDLVYTTECEDTIHQNPLRLQSSPPKDPAEILHICRELYTLVCVCTCCIVSHTRVNQGQISMYIFPLRTQINIDWSGFQTQTFVMVLPPSLER